MQLILASQSKHRKALLEKLGIPFEVHPADIDETEHKNEAPVAYNKRISLAKATKVAAEKPGCVILATDTCVYLGRRILQTPHTVEEAEAQLRLQSGRRVHIPSTVTVIDANGKIHTHTDHSWVKYKRFTEADLRHYLSLGKWKAAGAMQIEYIEPFIQTIHGSVSGIVGLPLYQTARLLARAGLKVNP